MPGDAPSVVREEAPGERMASRPSKRRRGNDASGMPTSAPPPPVVDSFENRITDAADAPPAHQITHQIINHGTLTVVYKYGGAAEPEAKLASVKAARAEIPVEQNAPGQPSDKPKGANTIDTTTKKASIANKQNETARDDPNYAWYCGVCERFLSGKESGSEHRGTSKMLQAKYGGCFC